MKCLKRTLYVEQLLNSLVVTPLPLAEFEVDPMLLAANRPAAGSAQSLAKKPKNENCSYNDVHAMAFAKYNLAWPPSGAELKDVLGDRVVACLNTRPVEVAYFLVKVFPFKKLELGVNVVRFGHVDLNNSLERLTGPAYNADPWRENVMTIVTKHIALMRCEKDGVTTYKVMDGIELMALQGWDLSYFKEGAPLPDNVLATRLAGNMFNAFMFIAFLFATTAGCSVYDRVVEAADDDKPGSESYSDSDEEEEIEVCGAVI